MTRSCKSFKQTLTNISGELYNPVVQGRELWPHETPDVWAVPADSGITVPGVSLVLDAAGCAVERDSVNNNLCALTPKSRVHTDSHSSIELEWENEEGQLSFKYCSFSFLCLSSLSTRNPFFFGHINYKRISRSSSKQLISILAFGKGCIALPGRLHTEGHTPESLSRSNV